LRNSFHLFTPFLLTY